MGKIILDCGFGAQCKNDIRIVRDMIFAIKEIDTGKHEIIFKWQLFEQKTIPNLIPLSHEIFDGAYNIAKKLGYETTSSVFDEESLDFLLTFNVPWIKIAARPDLYKSILPLIKKIPVVVSVGESECWFNKNLQQSNIICYLHCVPNYPAKIEEYEFLWNNAELNFSISDHTIGFDLYKKYKPTWWEKHYLLKKEPIDDPYGNDWYATPKELKEIL